MTGTVPEGFLMNMESKVSITSRITRITDDFNKINHLVKDLIEQKQVSLDSLHSLEARIGTLVNRTKKAIKKSAGETDSHGHNELQNLLFLIRQDWIIVKREYANLYNMTYDCGWNEDDIKALSSIDRKSISRNAFSKLVAGVIPLHPKDEYPLARRLKRRFIIHCGPTNTGKTYHALQSLISAKNGIYLSPLRLLALEVFLTLSETGMSVSLITGEEKILSSGSVCISSTIEMLDVGKEFDVAVIDEAQMVADKQRGSAWTKAILGVLAKEVHVCCSPAVLDLIIRLIEECGDNYETRKYERETELIVEDSRFALPDDVHKGDALIVFSKRMAISVASYLANKGFKVSLIYGNLPPESRRNQMHLFNSGETSIVVATDAIGMGLNLPIRRIVFIETEKFDGERKRRLTVSEIHQIAGRAGRKNIYDTGLVSSLSDRVRVADSLGRVPDPVSDAYYMPEFRFVLSIHVGTLQERLTTCMRLRSEQLGYFKKTDISQAITLLDALVKHSSLTNEEKLKLAFVPFDIKKKSLEMCWLSYVSAYKKKKAIPIPKYDSAATLDVLEDYYETLDLYYAFCRSMEIEFDSKAVSALKQQASEQINQILTTRMKELGKKCKYCGKALQWDFPFSICEKCYYTRF